MSADNQNQTADKTANPQNGGDGARASENAPVYVGSVIEYNRHMFASAKNNHQWSRIGQSIKRCGGVLSLGFAVMYVLLFAMTGWLLPQFHQAWLDLCMPLAEYIGGLTPRAGRITGQLIENGYPERANDALHGIAIARVLMVPVFVCVLAGVFSAKYRLFVVSCTHWTHIKIRLIRGLVLLTISALICLALAYFVYLWEFVIDEGFEGYGSGHISGIKELVNGYHRGNFAMMLELLIMGVLFFFVAMLTMPMAASRFIRFTIVKHPPEDKPEKTSQSRE